MFDCYCWDPGSSMIKALELLNIGSKIFHEAFQAVESS